MKHKIQLASLSFIVLFLSLSAALTSCNEDAVPANITPSSEYFKILGDTLIIPGDATTGTINVTADCGWSATISDKTGWNDLDLETQRGEGNGTISLSTEANSTPNERKAQLTITTDNGITKVLHIKQQPGKVELTLSEYELKFESSGGTHEITVTCNAEWTVSGGSDKIKVTSPTTGSGNGSFKITAEKNDSKESQEVTFTVIANNARAELKVTQMAKTLKLNVSPRSVEFGKYAYTLGKSKNIEISCNDEWTVTGSNDWFELEGALEGLGDTSQKNIITIKCQNNGSGKMREGYITIECDNITKTVHVQQSDKNINFDILASSLKFSHEEGQELNFTIESDTKWEIICNSTWLDIEPKTVTPNSYIEEKVKVVCTEKNTTDSIRKAIIIVKCENLKHEIYVEQDFAPTNPNQGGTPSYFAKITPNNLEGLDSKGDTYTLQVESNTTWTISGLTDWCHFPDNNDSYSGNNNEELSITVDANTSSDKRSTTLWLNYSDNKDPIQLIVAQKGSKEPGQGDNGTPDLTRRGAD